MQGMVLVVVELKPGTMVWTSVPQRPMCLKVWSPAHGTIGGDGLIKRWSLEEGS
jgi:hypothetical protein